MFEKSKKMIKQKENINSDNKKCILINFNIFKIEKQPETNIET